MLQPGGSGGGWSSQGEGGKAEREEQFFYPWMGGEHPRAKRLASGTFR